MLKRLAKVVLFPFAVGWYAFSMLAFGALILLTLPITTLLFVLFGTSWIPDWFDPIEVIIGPLYWLVN